MISSGALGNRMPPPRNRVLTRRGSGDRRRSPRGFAARGELVQSIFLITSQSMLQKLLKFALSCSFTYASA